MSQNSENLNIKKCIWKKCLGTSKLTIDKFQLLNYTFRGLNFGQQILVKQLHITCKQKHSHKRYECKKQLQIIQKTLIQTIWKQ